MSNQTSEPQTTRTSASGFSIMWSSLSLCALVLALSSTTASAQLTTAHTLDGDNTTDLLGSSVAGIGDINADLRSDFVAGAPQDDNNGAESGSARVYSGIDGLTVFTFLGDSAGDAMGTSVSGAGDVNNDGTNDIIVGAPGDDNNGSDSGSARVFSGTTGAILYTVNGLLPGDAFGSSVSGAGDVNGDGFDDFIVGAPQSDTNGGESGSATVFSGVDGSVIYTFNGDSAGDRLGSSVSHAGDANDDGDMDLLVGAPLDDNNGADSGSVRLYSGTDGSVLHTVNGDAAGDLLGSSVSAAGDVDEDDFFDFVAGAPGGDFARVYSGFDASTTYTFSGATTGINFGCSVSDAGDVNADGVIDVIVGADLADTNGADSGSATVFSGTTGAILHSMDGDSAGDNFGISVGGAGDINFDAFADVIVGAIGDDNNGADSGSARVSTAPFVPVLVYTSQLAVSRLRLRWAPDLGDPNSLTGTITCSNATTGAFGRFGLSLAPANSVLFGFPLLLAIDGFNLLDMGNFGYGLSGAVSVPFVTRQNPFLAGLFVFIQFFESAPFPASSNGLAMLVSP